MISNRSTTFILYFTLPLVMLVIIVSYAGLFNPDTYKKESPNWQAQALGQDIIDLFLITPFLLITGVLAYKKNRVALLLWSGILLYLIYTFVLYCFAVHFNYLFIFYCLTLGLAFYAFLYFLLSQINEPVVSWFTKKVPVKAAGIYLIVLSGLFYLLWLSEIIPSLINNTTPATIVETGLITNPVHALDLSVVLPGLMIIAILLLKRKLLGLLLVPAALTFSILMDITIGLLALIMKMKGMKSDIFMTIMMGMITLFTLFLLIRYLARIRLTKI
jgi:hypothetical protein